MPVTEIVTSDGHTRYLVLDRQGDVIVPVMKHLKFLDGIGHSRNGLRAKAYDLSLYFEFVQQRGVAYDAVSLDDMGKFVFWLKNPYRSLHLTPNVATDPARCNATINRMLGTVAGFYNYLWFTQQVPNNFAEMSRTYIPARFRSYKNFLYHISKSDPIETSLFKQKVTKSRPKTLTCDEIELLVEGCNNRRDRLLLTLLYETSMRVGEGLALWVEDIDVARCTIQVKDRGQLINGAEIKTSLCERTIDVSRDLINRVMTYISVAHDETVKTNHLFLKMRGPRRGQPMSYPEVYDLFQRLKHKTQIDVWPHILRHSSLTALAQAGLRPEGLQARAGHSQFQTTYQLYVHPSDQDIRQDWNQTMDVLRLTRNAAED